MRKFAIYQRLYYCDTEVHSLYIPVVFICKNAAQEWTEKHNQEHKLGRFTCQYEVTELTPHIINEIRHKYGWNNPSTNYQVLPDNE